MKKFILPFMLTVTLLVPFANTAKAEYPTKPITIVFPWTPGGAGDVGARILANAVKNQFAQPIVVVNRPGAGGIVGTAIVATSKADGYTLLGARVANAAIIPTLNTAIPYKWDDFDVLGLLDINPLVFVVHKDSPFTTLQELADAIKSKPGSITFANSGALNIQELTAFAFLDTLGLKKDGVIHVPFASDADGKNALLGKHVQAGSLNFPAVYDQLGEGGNLRALAVTTDKRLDDYPHIPTVREAGFPELENLVSWNALYTPKGTPQEVLDKWATIFPTLMDNDEWREPIKNLGSIPYVLNAEDALEFITLQRVKFKELGDSLDLYIK